MSNLKSAVYFLQDMQALCREQVSDLLCRALHAAVNVGRLCKFIIQNSLVHPISLNFNVVHKNDRRSLLITHRFVQKTYYMDKESQATLQQFYQDTAHVQYLEHAVKMKRSGNLELRLMPVGLERKPKTVDEAKVWHVCSCLCCPSDISVGVRLQFEHVMH